MIPALTDQNRYRRSIGFLTALRKRTMDSAPTIPKDTKRLDCIAIIIAATIIGIPASVTFRSLE